MEPNPELIGYLRQKRWQYRPVGDGKNIAVKVCPFCGKDKWKFWLNAQTTQWRCWHCPARGNLYKLKLDLGDTKQAVVSAAHAAGVDTKKSEGKPVPLEHVARWHQALLADEKALAYCEGRGLTREVIEHFQLGVQRKHGTKWLAIPHLVAGVCWNVKFRSLPPADKTFRRIKGSASVLFNADALADGDEVVLCEAETDAMSFWAAGVKNVVGLTCGCETFLPEWYDLLATKERVIICLDADTPGQTGARDIARRLGFDKCENVLLPGHDANDVLQQLGPEELKQSLERAEKFEVEGVIRADELIQQSSHTDDMRDDGILTPWPSVNRMLGKGWQPGDLIILSAKVKTGKTTWALNVARHQARLNVPALFCCLEMRPRRIAAKLVAIERGKPADELTPVDYGMARFYLRGMPLLVFDPRAWAGAIPKPEKMFDSFREIVKRHGVKLLVFDHLHFLCRSLQYLTNEIGQVTRGFKLFAEEMEIVVLLIAQPRKVQGTRVITYDDIKDSSSIPADADQIILLHRNAVPACTNDVETDGGEQEQEVLEPKTLVRIDAARYQGGGECYLHYEGAAGTFHEMSDKPIRQF